MPKPKQYMSAMELAAEFGVHESSLHKLYSKKGFPKRSGVKLDAPRVCEWIIANTKKRSKLWAGASVLLGKTGISSPPSSAPGGETPPAKAAKPQKPAAKPILKIEKPISVDDLDEAKDEDFGAILDSFRRTVHESVRLCEQASASGNESLLQARLKTSGQAVEQLRKAEQSILDIQLARKSSLPADEVRVAFVAMASAIRAKLLQLPMKLGHELAGTRTAGEAQSVLDDEIRLILNDLSENPFGAV